MEGWWCVRFGNSLAWVEAPTASAAVQRSLGLHPLGDWTDDAGELVVFPQDAYPENTGPHDYTRAVLNANPPPRRRRSDPRESRPAPALACLAAVVALGFGLSQHAAAETWRGLTVAPENRCSPYDRRRDYPYPQPVEREIVRDLGAVYGPPDGPVCAADAVTKVRFPRHLRSLTLAQATEAASRTVPGMTPSQTHCGNHARSESAALTGSRPTGDILIPSVVPAVNTRESR